MYKRVLWFTCFLLLGALVNAGVAAWDPNTDPALIGWWRCEEGQGSTVADSSPNQNNGTFVEGDPAWTTGFYGKGYAIKLAYPTLVEVPPMGLTLTQATMAGWVLPNGTQSDWASFIMHRGPGPAHGFNMLGSRQLAYHWNDDAASWNYRGTAYYAADEWTHCAVTIEPTKATFYVNGVSASVNAIPHAAATWDGPVWLGGDRTYTDGTRHLNGALDDVMFFSRALTAAEIKSLVPPQLKARKPTPADGTLGVTMPLLQWTKGDTALFHDVYFGTSPDLTAADLKATHQPFAMYYHVAGITPGVTYYWRVDGIEPTGQIYTGDVWSFTVMPLTAYLPQPADEAANVTLSPTLSWTAGQSALGHHVYFGTDRNAVQEGAAGTDKGALAVTETSYKVAEALKPDTTYYWRVDETGAGGKIETGEVWSFTTVLAGPVGAIRQWWSNIGAGTTVADLTGNPNFPDNPTGTEFIPSLEGPVGWADNYGTRLYGWLYPPQSGDYIFWVAGDDGCELRLSTDADQANKKLIATVATWTNSREWTKEVNQRSSPVTLEAGQRYYIEALQKEGGGGDSIAVAWQGPGISQQVISAGGVGPTPLLPVRAYSPLPPDGAVDTVQTITLSWDAGEKAQQHEVYFGDDANAVAAADSASDLYKGRQAGTSYNAGALEWGKTYYWRIDEINEGDAESPWVGRVWSFTTANFIPVDDFESYNDDPDMGTRIYETWLDGQTNTTTSTVGNWDPPFAEQTIVHGGEQSMPMDYNNIHSPFYAEAEREFAPVQNWTAGGVTDLSLWFRGNPAKFVETEPGKYSITSNSGDVWDAADNFRFVYKKLNGDGAIVAKVNSLANTTSNWAKAGVMIRESLDPASSYAFMFPTPDGRRAFQNRPNTGGTALSAHSGTQAVTFPVWVKVERKGSQFTAYYSQDGKTWVEQPDNENTGADASMNPQVISMTGSVYIGMAVTSNNAAAGACIAEFSDVTTAGSVSGPWTVASVGPNPGNDAGKLYVVVQDSANKTAVVVHPDPAATNVAEWTEWKIPLSDLAGVNLAKVKKLFIGVGDRANPAADGGGRIYIDDVRVMKP